MTQLEFDLILLGILFHYSIIKKKLLDYLALQVYLQCSNVECLRALNMEPDCLDSNSNSATFYLYSRDSIF